MQRADRHIVLTVLTACAISGCSTFSHLWPTPGSMLTKDGGRTSTTSPTPILSETFFENPNLLSLLDPRGKRCGNKPLDETTKLCNGEILPTDDQVLMGGVPALDDAYLAFYDSNPDKFRRNRIQDRLLQVSDSKCYAYLNYLKRAESQNSSWFGSVTTILAGAASVTGGSRDPRVLAGLASVFSGVGAETKQAFFANLAVSIISPGIERRRSLILKKLRDQQAEEITEYSVESAVKDAITYHGECHILAGLEEANSAIKEVRNPGIQTMLATQLQINALKKVQGGGSLTPEDARNFDFIYALNGTVGGATAIADRPTLALVEARVKLGELRDSLIGRINNRIAASAMAAPADKLPPDLIGKYQALVAATGSDTLKSLVGSIAEKRIDTLSIKAHQIEAEARALRGLVAAAAGAKASGIEVQINNKRAEALKDVISKLQETTEATQAAFDGFADYVATTKTWDVTAYAAAIKKLSDLVPAN